MTPRRAVPALTISLLTLTMGCAAINRAHDRRVQKWERSGITVAEAREILGTTPYAVPGLEIVAIHVDRPTQVVMVEQRLEPGTLISLSQHRGHTRLSYPREFWAYERLSVERVPYNGAGTPFGLPDPTSRYVQARATYAVTPQLAARWFTRTTDDLTIRIWGQLPGTRLTTLLNGAEPITN